jgi:hypothetical protein
LLAKWLNSAFHSIRRETDMQQGLGGNWAREPHLIPEQLNSVHGLNQRFLDLAGGGADQWDAARAPGGNLMLAAGLAQQLAPLSRAQRAAVASCPYALFDMRFEDEAYWKSRLTQTVQFRVADGSADVDVVDFARLALFYAWHVSCTTSLAAQLLLGMSPATVDSFRSLGVNSLPGLAAAEATNLCARWRNCAAYWNALLGAAARTDPHALRRVQLYGLQLAAAAHLP